MNLRPRDFFPRFPVEHININGIFAGLVSYTYKLLWGLFIKGKEGLLLQGLVLSLDCQVEVKISPSFLSRLFPRLRSLHQRTQRLVREVEQHQWGGERRQHLAEEGLHPGTVWRLEEASVRTSGNCYKSWFLQFLIGCCSRSHKTFLVEILLYSKISTRKSSQIFGTE